MKYNSTDKVRVLVNKFLKSKDTLIIMPYKGKKLNSFMDWKKIHFIPRLYFVTAATQLLRWFPPSPFKNSCYRLLGYKIGKNVGISPGALLDPLFPELISIEDNVIIGLYAQILVHFYTHNEITLGRVNIKSNVLLGAFSVIIPGVTVGKSSAVSASSNVFHDVPSKVVVRGNPAQVVKKYVFKKKRGIIVKK